MWTDMARTDLAKGTLPDDTVEIEVVEADFAVEVNWLGEAASHGIRKANGGREGYIEALWARTRVSDWAMCLVINRNFPSYSSVSG
jgi:hypothetical protein